MLVLGRRELLAEAEHLARGDFYASASELLRSTLDRLLPPENISTIKYSEKYRVIRKPDGMKTGWSRALTPFLVPVMDAHDDPEVLEIIVPKPSRCGGTVVAENHALKRLDFGPTGDIMWYLAGPEEVRSYAERVFKPLFEDHAGVASRLGSSASDNKKTMKRVGSQTIELMVMSGKTTTNRQGAYIVFDEPDSYHRDYRSNFLEQGRQRQRMLGNDRKIYACAHPDIGWSGGIGAAWVLSTQGIFAMPCAACGEWSSPYPTKYWPDVPRYRLHYTRSPEGTAIDRRMAQAEKTAGMLCPNCGVVLDEAERTQMVERGRYMHKGQSLDIKLGIVGDPEKNRTWGFWVHVLMSRQVAMAELARELEGAIEHRERTGKSDKIKQVLVRTFGEVFEGASDLKGLDARVLKDRTRELENDGGGAVAISYRMGEVPAGVRFLTMAVDVGGGKFDILVRGWDGERRSWLIDRRTIRQRQHADGVWRDIAPSKSQEDWTVLEHELDRLYPLQDDPGHALPIAVMTVDASDGNVTWRAYEFARRMDRRRWATWRRVRCIKGATSPKAEPLPPSPTKISRDSEGKPVDPVVTLHLLGVHRLKEEVVSDLAIDDHGPGHCYFAGNTPDRTYDELFNEVPIDGKWVRNGPQETLDLYGYTEAARLMLQPDRADRKWSQAQMPPGKIWTVEHLPPWARPIPLFSEGGDPAATGQGNDGGASVKTAKPTTIERFSALNRRN